MALQPEYSALPRWNLNCLRTSKCSSKRPRTSVFEKRCYGPFHTAHATMHGGALHPGCCGVGTDPEGDTGVIVQLANLLAKARRTRRPGRGPRYPFRRRGRIDRPSNRGEIVRDFARACGTVPALHEDGTAARVATFADRLEASASSAELEGARQLAELFVRPVLPARTRTQKIEASASAAREACRALRDAALSTLSRALGEHTRELVLLARKKFRLLKQQRQALDFGDLMRGLREALRSRPGLRKTWKWEVQCRTRGRVSGHQPSAARTSPPFGSDAMKNAHFTQVRVCLRLSSSQPVCSSSAMPNSLSTHFAVRTSACF